MAAKLAYRDGMAVLVRKMHHLLYRLRPMPPFRSAQYWEERYAQGGNSGAGSFGRLAEYKAGFVNGIVNDKKIESVLEFGAGDGNQLALLCIPRYIGLDVSPTAIALLQKRFQDDASKTFYLIADSVPPISADMTMSLDVIFHLVEDDIFERYMESLFKSAKRYVMIYSSNFAEYHNNGNLRGQSHAQHVRHRRFTDFVASRFKEWALMESFENPCKNETDSAFFIYERKGQ